MNEMLYKVVVIDCDTGYNEIETKSMKYDDALKEVKSLKEWYCTEDCKRIQICIIQEGAIT